MELDTHQQLVEKYKERIKAEFGEAATKTTVISSKEYSDFKEELYPTHYSLYEKGCNFADKLLRLKADPIKSVKTQKSIEVCHLNVTPSGVTSFAILAALMVVVFGSLATYGLPILFGIEPMLFFVIFFLVVGVILVPALQRVPEFMANTWRMK